ncbi:MAG: tripartite tricarboxylate transporter TctB family protein [Deltaproteobacteria bacterium]|nr:tripartite tricarboxylate transporter TctB family protein [Deltaproteobacteria bacterium]
MEMIFNIVMGLFILFYLVLAFFLKKESLTGDALGAGGFPMILGIIGLAMLVFITAKIAKDKTKIPIPLLNLKSVAGRLLALNVVILSAYLLLMDIIGFALSTLLFLFGSARGMGYKKTVVLSLFSLLLTVILVVTFGKLFFVPLPRGIGVFRELSYFIY